MPGRMALDGAPVLGVVVVIEGTDNLLIGRRRLLMRPFLVMVLLGVLFLAEPCKARAGTPSPVRFEVVNPSKAKKIIVFVHGLWSDPQASFSPGPGRPTWADLMRGDNTSYQHQPPLSSYAVATISFPAKWGVKYSVARLAMDIREELVAKNILDYEEIIFITHSLGGLVVKEMLATDSTAEISPILKRTTAIFFIATPANGSPTADNPFIRLLTSLDRYFPQQLILDLRSERNAWLDGLQQRWYLLLDRVPGLPAIYCAHETEPWLIFMPVPELYADKKCREPSRRMVENHIGISKPTSTASDNYEWVSKRIAAVSRALHGPPVANVPARVVAVEPPGEEKPLEVGSLDKGTPPEEAPATPNRSVEGGPEERISPPAKNEDAAPSEPASPAIGGFSGDVPLVWADGDEGATSTVPPTANPSAEAVALAKKLTTLLSRSKTGRQELEKVIINGAPIQTPRFKALVKTEIARLSLDVEAAMTSLLSQNLSEDDLRALIGWHSSPDGIRIQAAFNNLNGEVAIRQQIALAEDPLKRKELKRLLPARRQPVDLETRRELAQRYVDLMDREASVEAFLPVARELVPAEMSEEDMQRLLGELREKMLKYTFAAQVEAMAWGLSTADLKKVVGFYESGAGRRYMSIAPKLVQFFGDNLAAFRATEKYIALLGIEMMGGAKPIKKTSRFRVIGVAENDHLNVRSGPGLSYATVGHIEWNAIGVETTGRHKVVSGATWVEVKTAEGVGWANSYHLLEARL